MIAKGDIVIVNPKTMELAEQVDLTDLEGCTFTSAAISINKDDTLSWIAANKDNQELIKFDTFDEFEKYTEENK
tara:strand:+ start:42 stop:263 length:222 start_codon:yes stop_codon:yes gene_type:complete